MTKKTKKEIEVIITIGKQQYSPEEQKMQKAKLFFFLLEQHRKLTKTS